MDRFLVDKQATFGARNRGGGHGSFPVGREDRSRQGTGRGSVASAPSLSGGRGRQDNFRANQDEEFRTRQIRAREVNTPTIDPTNFPSLDIMESPARLETNASLSTIHVPTSSA